MNIFQSTMFLFATVAAASVLVSNDIIVPFRYGDHYPIHLVNGRLRVGTVFDRAAPQSMANGIPDLPLSLMVMVHGTIYRAMTDNFLITRRSVNENILVFNPTNPLVYTGTNEMFYSPIPHNRTMYFHTVPNIIVGNRIVSVDNWAFMTFLQTVAPIETLVPESVFDQFIELFENLVGGTHINEPQDGDDYPIYIVSANVLSELPTIRLTLAGGIIAITPNDYLIPTNVQNHYQLVVLPHRHDAIMLGNHILNRLTIYIDNHNSRIGFGNALFVVNDQAE